MNSEVKLPPLGTSGSTFKSFPEGSAHQSWQAHPAIRTQEEPRIPAEVETLRDRFAMAALSSIMLGADAGKIDDSELAAICYGLASAMMEARKKCRKK